LPESHEPRRRPLSDREIRAIIDHLHTGKPPADGELRALSPRVRRLLAREAGPSFGGRFLAFREFYHGLEEPARRALGAAAYGCLPEAAKGAFLMGAFLTLAEATRRQEGGRP
jgi:hypothetical protein